MTFKLTGGATKLSALKPEQFRVVKMKHPKRKDPETGKSVNDANHWATETMNNTAYPLELLQRIITVSLETMKIVNNLPKLDID